MGVTVLEPEVRMVSNKAIAVVQGESSVHKL